ncbi:hypothetical protein [Vallitalea okinawensis]|uniref:hypothetical protein n=1 Tax=Vallitalea okinawensis TaxID=2078660 RepID=UPI000CFC29C9|nr:hypothetical protein [Vallitalea okinawensis]
MGIHRNSNINNSFKISGTIDRKGAKYNYIIVVNKSMKEKLGSFAVIEHKSPNYDKPLRAYGRVLINNKLKSDEVMLDQTIRTAIGISYNNDSFYGFSEVVNLYPLKVSLKQHFHTYIASIFAIRYIYCRFNVPNIIDAEKNIVRIPEDTFDLIGCSNRDTIICEFPAKVKGEYILKTYKSQGYIASTGMIDERIRVENDEDDPNNTRYLSSLKLLGLQPDIPRIFLDYHIREKLNTQELQPIAIRRDVKGLFFKQIIEFGLVLMVTLITLISIVPGEITWGKLVVTSLLASLVSIVLIILKIRSTLK